MKQTFSSQERITILNVFTQETKPLIQILKQKLLGKIPLIFFRMIFQKIHKKNRECLNKSAFCEL